MCAGGPRELNSLPGPGGKTESPVEVEGNTDEVRRTRRKGHLYGTLFTNKSYREKYLIVRNYAIKQYPLLNRLIIILNDSLLQTSLLKI